MTHANRRQAMTHGGMRMNHYARLITMVALSFVAMYVLMYSMVNTFADVYNNVNQFYMAGLMAAPMIAIELLVMSAMYGIKKFNIMLLTVSVLAALAFFFGIRHQTGVSEKQFLKSMIPHHSSAILMCREANIESRAVQELCEGIVSSQQAEIDQMRALLQR